MAFLLLLLCACQSTSGATGGTRASPNRITEAELADLTALTVYQAIQRIRPTWLHARVSTIRGSSGARYPAQVFVDGMPRGELDVLNAMDIRDVQEIRFLSASDATTRFGTGYPGGIIDVIMKRGGGGGP
jgi:hypothetical protein